MALGFRSPLGPVAFENKTSYFQNTATSPPLTLMLVWWTLFNCSKIVLYRGTRRLGRWEKVVQAAVAVFPLGLVEAAGPSGRKRKRGKQLFLVVARRGPEVRKRNCI